jgi:hypothetical protein
MNGFISKTTGSLMLLVGATGLLAVAALLMFFAGLFGNIRSLLFMGPLNDVLNVIASILSAILASVLHPTVRRIASRLSLVGLMSVCWRAGSCVWLVAHHDQQEWR